MGLFSKKPGGTMFGNLFREVAAGVTMGTLGAGKNKIEVGQTKTNKELGVKSYAGSITSSSVSSSVLQKPASDPLASVIRNQGLSVFGSSPVQAVDQQPKQDNNMLLLLGGGLLLFLIFKK